MINKKAFSLIEVIIATTILTITVFGVYKLIGENSKILNNADNFIKANTLFNPLEQCIKNLGIVEKGSYNFNFGKNLTQCYTGTANIVKIDNIEYLLSGTLSSSGWILQVSNDEIGKIIKTFHN